MRRVIKYLLITIAIFLIGLLLYGSIAKLHIMEISWINPHQFHENSIEYHYHTNQLIPYIHIVGGIVFLLLGAYQFIPFFRNSYRRLHRFLGKVFLILSLIISLTAIYLAIFIPFSDHWETITTLIFGLYIIYATLLAYNTARKKKFIQHSLWVLRVYGVVLSVATIRILVALGILWTGDNIKSLLGPSFAIAFLLHVVIVETWIRTGRRG